MKAKSFFIGLFLSLILCLTIVNSGAADTTVSGIINNDTTWTLASSPYIVTGNLLVSEGMTLNIEPGVEVRFETEKVLQIEGTLIARGTNDNVITFTSNQSSPAPGDWGDIYFTDTSQSATFDEDKNYTGGSILEYCIVEYAGGLDLDNNGAVRMDNACPFINYCTIQNNSASGIICDHLDTEIIGELRITNNTIKDNTASTGVRIDFRRGIITISSNTIVNNIGDMGGIYIWGANAGTIITITDNVVSNNSSEGVYSIENLTISGGNATIKNNTISYNSGCGLRLTNNYSVTIDSNIINDNKGGDLNVGSNSVYGPTNITNNTVSNNFGRGVFLSVSAILTDNIISNNSGGGIICYNGDITISNNIIDNNYSEGPGDYDGGSGGGILAWPGYKQSVSMKITNNIISNNVASVCGGGISFIYIYSTTPISISKNTIVNNCSQNAPAIYYLPYEYGDKDFNQNTITGNISTGTEPTYAVYVSSHPLFNYNNIFNNTATYELYNANSADSDDMNAENNWWGTDEESEIQAKIYDWFDDGTKGFVDYSPFLTYLDTTAPISPPSNLTVVDTDTESITIQWDANQESDIAGYKVYWDTDGELPYENVVDVESDTTYTITGVDPANCYIGVTAYDNDYNATNDDPDTIVNENQTNGNESWYSTAAPPSPISGYLVTDDLWIGAIINSEEKGPIEAVWQKGGEDTTSRGDRVIWGYFYASPSDVTWGSENNPDLFVKIWFDVSGRVDVNYFHVSVPDIVVYSDYPYDDTPDEQGTTTMSMRYIRQYYENGQSYSEENYEDGNPPSGYSPSGNPLGYSIINDLRIGSMINTVEKGPIDALWRFGGQDTTDRGDQVVWGHFYANPSDVTWGSENNPDLFVKIWFDVSGRVDVNYFHVSVPDIEVYSDLPDDGTYDQKGTTIMDNRYIRHEYWR